MWQSYNKFDDTITVDINEDDYDHGSIDVDVMDHIDDILDSCSANELEEALKYKSDRTNAHRGYINIQCTNLGQLMHVIDILKRENINYEEIR